MKTKKFASYLTFAFSLCCLILPMLVGCGTVEAGVLPQPENVNPDRPESGMIDLDRTGTIEFGIEPTPLPERTSYTNETYGFAFDYPESWALTEEDHGVILKKDTNRLGINFRWADESDVQPSFGRTGMGAGDFIYAGKINFLNQVIPANELLFEKKTKAVFYGENGQVEIGDLFFMIVLEDLETDYLEVDLPVEIMDEADIILESFRSLDPETGTETSLPPSGLEAYLKIQNSIQQGSREPLTVYFLLENHAQQGLYLLKWYTPLEGIAGDIFEVTRDGQPIPYLGLLASRANPTPESYIFLKPGDGVTAEVNIAEAYDFSQIGTYSIQFRSPRISHIAESEAELATTLDELGPVNISSIEVTLEVVDSSSSAGLPVRHNTDEATEMISAYLLEQNPGLLKAPPLRFEEIPDERIWEKLQGQVFRVTEGIFQDESFLLWHDSVIQLGEAVGGQGLTSLVVFDLDQDGQSELLFSYIAALGPGIGPGIQTRVGMYKPDFETRHTIEADMAYLGSAALKFEDPTTVNLNVIENNESTRVLRYLDTLGYLSIENTENGLALVLNVDPNISPEIKKDILTKE